MCKYKYFDKIDYKCIIDEPIIIFNNTTKDDYLYIDSFWSSISNEVQYKKPQLIVQNANETNKNTNCESKKVNKKLIPKPPTKKIKIQM
jgi:hypothetical protein